MPFPDEALDVRVEIRVGLTWVDITHHVFTRDPITITRGRPDEGSQVEPSRCRLTINNTDGRYSPRNPRSPYYGLIGRNTPLRVSVPYGQTYLALNGSTSGIGTPDSVALSITGDIDVRVDVTADNWQPEQMLAAKARYTGTERESWLMWVENAIPKLAWSPTGAQSARIKATCTAPLPVTQGRVAVRATLDVDNGAGGWTARFYTAASISGPWVQLGDPVTGVGVTSIYDGNTPVEFGKSGELSSPSVLGRWHAGEVRAGIGGTVVASPSAGTQPPGATSFADAQGNTWTLTNAELADRDYRFWGEVPSWPVSWAPSGALVWIEIEAAGIKRRLGQGAKPLASALRRSLSSANPPYTAYWSLEDAPGSTQAAPGVPGLAPMMVTGEVEFSDEPSGGTAGGVTPGAGGRLFGRVPRGASEWAIAAWIDLPADMGTDGLSPVLQWTTPGAGAAKRWSVYTGQAVGGRMLLEAANDANAIVVNDVGTADVRGRGPILVMVAGFNVGGNVTVQVSVGDNVDLFQAESTGDVTAPIASAGVNMDVAADAASTGTISHLVVCSYGDPSASVYIAEADGVGSGYTGEPAAARIERLAEEEQLPLTVTGVVEESASMGPQHPRALLELLAEAEAADGGTLTEARGSTALHYRTRGEDYNSSPGITLAYTQVAAPLEPVDDDDSVRNDVTVEREGGSSARAIRTDGPLSVAAPPDGVGIYDEAITLNLATDGQLADQAGWRLHLGTVDEARYPVLGVKLHKHPALIPAVLDLDVRSRIHLTGLPEWLPPDTVDLLVDGYTEVIEPLRWTVHYNTVPGSPWRVGVLDDDVLGRLDTAGAELAAAVDADDTTLSVATTLGPLWTTAPVECPFDVRLGGEVATVTAVTGAASPQSMTVIRSVNGITKSHAAGTDVRLAQPLILAL